jgi:uncharacterized protein
MLDKKTILNKLKTAKTSYAALGISSVGLFGSFVRDEQSKNSDIDILLDFQPEYENFDNFMAACRLFEEIFAGEKIEIVTKNGLSPYIGPTILKEVLYV